MLTQFMSALEAATKDPSCMMVTVTGIGDYYTSGNDLNNFMQQDVYVSG